MKKQLSLPVLAVGTLSAVTILAPMFGIGGIAAALVAASVLIPLLFHYAFQGQRSQVHYHYYETREPRPYTEGHERAALLPNGVQVRERVVRRFD